MLTCKELTERVTEYTEGRMRLPARLAFWAHLVRCGHCRAYLRQMRLTVLALGVLPEEPVEPLLRDELLARFREMRPALGTVPLARPWGIAALERWLCGSRGFAVVAFILAVAGALAFLQAGWGGSELRGWSRCLFLELSAAVLPIAVVGAVARRARERLSAGALAAVGAGGGFVGYLWLSQGCPSADALSHVLVAHVGGLLLGALLGVAASRLPALRTAVS
jgi:hypothetical protein